MPASGDVPRVSILIVNYRSYAALRECLASLERQSLKAEVVVIDHASEPDALDPLRVEHASVLFDARRENDGFGRGINRAARLAHADYLLVLNPDVVLKQHTAECLATWLDQRAQVGVVAPLVRSGHGAIEASARAFPSWSTVIGGRSTFLSRVWRTNPLTRRNLLTGPDVSNPIDVDWVSGACMLVRRSAFEAVGGFDERFFLYWEDADLCRRIRDAGWTVMYVPTCHVEHRGGQSSRHAPRASTRAFHESVFRYFLKHGGRFRYALAPIVFLALQVRLRISLARANRQK